MSRKRNQKRDISQVSKIVYDPMYKWSNWLLIKILFVSNSTRRGISNKEKNRWMCKCAEIDTEPF